MKNLLIYINPRKKRFSSEHADLTKIQIDNSLDLGWPVADIMLVTNFDFEYRGVKAIVVNDYAVFDANRSTKIPAINELFTRNLIKPNEIYWFHDHDAFQLVPFEVAFETDAAFTTEGWSSRWNAGCFFFKDGSRDIFSDIWEYMNLRKTNEQDALTYMWSENIRDINSRYKIMDTSFNIGIYHITDNLKKAMGPMKVAHFHPHKPRHLNLFRAMLPANLMAIFTKYGIY